ncbi:hypothetical protein ACFYYS_17670 [Streptomyces sp. NPDC002120]|uniref:hypothetical protein n=1 Tax=Streptomyces sp. NPDC002120 TaxID=3364631 RepID=UPI003695B53C
MEPVPDTAPWKARWVDLAPPRRSGYTLTTLSDPVTRLTVFRHAGDQYVACASDSGEVEVWNLDMNRQVLRTNTTADIPITGLDTGVHDGAVFLAASDPTTVYLWEIFGGGRLTASWKAGNDYSDSEATAVAFADIDDRLVLHVLDDGHDVERFDVTKRERLPNLRLSDNHGFHRYHASVAVTILNAAPTAVIGTWGGVHLADLRTGRTSRLTSPDPGGFVAGVRRVPGRGPLRLVTGALNHRIHELRFPGDSMTVRRCPESVRDVDVRLHDGKAFVLAAYDGSDRPLEVFSLAGDGFSTSDFYVDGREAVYQVRSVELHHGHWVVIAGERSGRVHVWDFPELPS